FEFHFRLSFGSENALRAADRRIHATLKHQHDAFVRLVNPCSENLHVFVGRETELGQSAPQSEIGVAPMRLGPTPLPRRSVTPGLAMSLYVVLPKLPTITTGRPRPAATMDAEPEPLTMSTSPLTNALIAVLPEGMLISLASRPYFS